MLRKYVYNRLKILQEYLIRLIYKILAALASRCQPTRANADNRSAILSRTLLDAPLGQAATPIYHRIHTQYFRGLYYKLNWKLK